jgi:protein phosphatase
MDQQPSFTTQQYSLDQRHETGPFDIIGDIHGCFDEFYQLLLKLGYQINKEVNYHISHPKNRKLILVGDLVDRGPNTPEVLRLVIDMVESQMAFCVLGNHDDRLARQLRGNPVEISHGLAQTITQLATEPDHFKTLLGHWLEALPCYQVFDNGQLIIAHAGFKSEFLEKEITSSIRAFCLYGATGGLDANGKPIRYPWAKDYTGLAMIAYGHTPILEPQWINNTINLDTGCVFGGNLTALRYPEKLLVSVPAIKIWYE